MVSGTDWVSIISDLENDPVSKCLCSGGGSHLLQDLASEREKNE